MGQGQCEGHLEALAILVIERVGGGLQDDGLAVQHVVLPHHDLHECFAPTEVQERPPTHMGWCCFRGLVLQCNHAEIGAGTVD